MNTITIDNFQPTKYRIEYEILTHKALANQYNCLISRNNNIYDYLVVGICCLHRALCESSDADKTIKVAKVAFRSDLDSGFGFGRPGENSFTYQPIKVNSLTYLARDKSNLIIDLADKIKGKATDNSQFYKTFTIATITSAQGSSFAVPNISELLPQQVDFTDASSAELLVFKLIKEIDVNLFKIYNYK
jgi:hypothetical protein